MQTTSIAFIARAARYSPQRADKDMAILVAVRQQLQAQGYHCLAIVPETSLDEVSEADAYVSMGRSQETLNWLGAQEHRQVPVVNSTPAVMLCNHRSQLMKVLEGEVPVPPLTGDNGYWVKRGYGCRETDADVQYAADKPTADRLCADLLARGIADVDVRAHVEGHWVKFYGVRGTDFFHYLYPQGGVVSVDGQRLRQVALQAAATAKLDVYGGDCIVRPDGQPVLVDLNDWPSFSSCQPEAAVAIARRVRQVMDDR